MGLPRLSWTALDLKNLKTNVFKFFANAGFRYFETLDGLLGLTLAPLGLIRSHNGSPKLARKSAKSGPKISPKQVPILGSFSDLFLGGRRP